jgi:putative ABC transport system ATP-binding protein
LSAVGVAALGDRLPSPLCGGQQQRVAIARALVTDPRVILADEPTGNLDSDTGAGIIDLLARLAADRSATVIVATHNADLAERAPRRISMRDGRIVESLALATDLETAAL